jgi:hypothetical protein
MEDRRRREVGEEEDLKEGNGREEEKREREGNEEKKVAG